MWLSNLLANVSLSVWYQLHDGLLAGQAAGADQAHFGLVRASTRTHPQQDDDHYWQPKRGYLAAATFGRLLAGRVVGQTPLRAGRSAKTNTTFALSFVRLHGGRGARKALPPAADGADAAAAEVIVAWCTEFELLPCALELGGLGARSCFGRSDFTGD
eukprot:SAG11_NODE_15792_length_566_cov_0.991435_1_plen_157_part_10